MQYPGWHDNLHPVRVRPHPNKLILPDFMVIGKVWKSGKNGPRLVKNSAGINDGKIHILCHECHHIFDVSHHYNDKSKHVCLRRFVVSKIVFGQAMQYCRYCANLKLRWTRLPQHYLNEHEDCSSLHNSETDSERRKRMKD